MSGSLFDSDEPPQLAARLAPVLRSLAERGVYFGTSSWKYEGWLGSIYSRDRYPSRGRFSKKKFEADCLREYAETFPVVGDFSFYPYAKIQEPDPGTRTALREIAARAQHVRQRSYIFVNNRLEGNAPTTIEAVSESLANPQ